MDNKFKNAEIEIIELKEADVICTSILTDPDEFTSETPK